MADSIQRRTQDTLDKAVVKFVEHYKDEPYFPLLGASNRILSFNITELGLFSTLSELGEKLLCSDLELSAAQAEWQYHEKAGNKSAVKAKEKYKIKLLKREALKEEISQMWAERQDNKCL